MTQTTLMFAIAFICGVSALLWAVDGEPWAALAFLCFGLGYVALAGVFAP